MALVLAAVAPVLAAHGAPYGAVGAPDHLVTIAGDGVGTYPAFDPSVARYAVTTSAQTGGTVTVRASTSDPQGTVMVDGRTAPGGQRTMTGLRPGDEISVVIIDAGGAVARSFIYLPDAFPELRRTTAQDPRTTDGTVLLTLGKWISPGPFFETAVDKNGVPVYVRQTTNSMDLHRQPNGHYSVARGGANGADIVELDDQFREVRRLRTTGLVHTDGHDAILEADGSAYLMAYEPDSATGLTDAIIQHVSATGELLFEWNSADHVDIDAETVVGDSPDYAHVNSFEVMADGDLLVSFRHLSSVFKIARRAHDGFEEGEVVWRLGGRASDFTFTDTTGGPDGGPCAQHTATELENGDIMVFDNGAWHLDPLCIDPVDPSGPPVARTPTRIAQWSLDGATMSASMVKDVTVQGRYAIFAGSAQALEGGNTVVGWASATQAVASELSSTGEVLWEIEAPEDPKYFTYRASKTVVPDAISPQVRFLDGTDRTVAAVGDREVPDLACTDRGGSNLQSCVVSDFDTAAAGSGTLTVVATDGAGNETTIRRAYTTLAPTPTASPSQTPSTTVVDGEVVLRRPDLQVKAIGRRWRGRDAYDVRRGQTAADATTGARSVYRVRLQNDGTAADRFAVRLRGRANTSAPAWVVEGRRSKRLAPGESVTFRMVVNRGRRDLTTTQVIARSVAVTSARDRVRARTTWR